LTSYPVPPPASARPLPVARHLRGCLAEALRAAARLPSSRPRTPVVSIAEYERRWAHAARRAAGPADGGRAGEGQGRGAQAGPPGGPGRGDRLDRAVELSSFGQARLHALIDASPYAVDAPAFFRWRADKLAAVFGTHHPPATPIAEIGCGMGKNLLALSRAGYDRLAGYDPAPSAAAAVATMAGRYGLAIETGRFDLLNPDEEILARLRGQVLFTNHVLEQLPRHLPEALECLLRAAPLEVMHIEPCPEALYPWRRASDLATWLHTRAGDYQRTLLGELARWQRAGRITIAEVTPLGYAPRPRSAPTLVRWRPARG
jgi:hypothetical protein